MSDSEKKMLQLTSQIYQMEQKHHNNMSQNINTYLKEAEKNYLDSEKNRVYLE